MYGIKKFEVTTAMKLTIELRLLRELMQLWVER